MPELKVKVSADTRGFTQGMNFTKAEVQAWNRVLKEGSDKSSKEMTTNYTVAFAGIAAAAAVTGHAIKESLEFGHNMQNMSDRTGISSDMLQRVGLEAKLAGSSIEEVTGFMEHLAKSSEEALGGNREMQEVFERMGISIEKLESSTLEERFKMVREHMRDTKVDAESIADLLKVGGKGAGQLMPMLRGGEASSLAVNNADEIASLSATAQKLTQWKSEAAAVGRSIVNSVADPIMNFLTFGEHAKKIAQTLKEQEAHGDALTKGSARAEAEEKKKQAEADKKAQKEAEDHAKKIAALQEQVNKSVRDYQFSRLKTDDERIAFLEEERDKLQAIANDFSKPEEDRLKAQAQMNQKQQEIDKLGDNQFNKALDDLGLGEADKLFKPKKESDSLLSVGNFLGSDPNAQVNRELRESKDLLREIRNNTKPPITGDTYPT